jgi:hypothetical protein
VACSPLIALGYPAEKVVLNVATASRQLISSEIWPARRGASVLATPPDAQASSDEKDEKESVKEPILAAQ